MPSSRVDVTTPVIIKIKSFHAFRQAELVDKVQGKGEETQKRWVGRNPSPLKASSGGRCGGDSRDGPGEGHGREVQCLGGPGEPSKAQGPRARQGKSTEGSVCGPETAARGFRERSWEGFFLCFLCGLMQSSCRGKCEA